MYIHLLATLAMGAMAAGLVFAIARTVGWKKPGLAYPIAIGGAMLGYAVYDEYSWYQRSASALPNQLEVVRTYATSMPYQPWTYAVPRIFQYDAADLSSVRSNPNAPGLRLVRLVRVTRNTSSADISVVIDCARGRYAEVSASTKFTAEGVPKSVDWNAISDHQVLGAAICNLSVPKDGEA